MKRFIVQITLLSLLVGCLGAVPAADSKKRLSRILSLPGLTKARIYDRTVLWFQAYWGSPKGSITNRDRDAGIIKGNGYMKSKLRDGLSFVVVRIEFLVREGETSITLTGEEFRSLTRQGYSSSILNADIPDIQEGFRSAADNYAAWLKE